MKTLPEAISRACERSDFDEAVSTLARHLGGNVHVMRHASQLEAVYAAAWAGMVRETRYFALLDYCEAIGVRSCETEGSAGEPDDDRVSLAYEEDTRDPMGLGGI